MNLNKKEEYWNKRSEQRLVDAENLTTSMLKKLKKVYEKAYLEIEKELNAFYGKYSTETGLDITEVRKRLDPKELKTFKEQLQIYYDEVKRLGGYSKDTKEYLRELSAKAYISRLDALQAQLRFQIETLYRQVNLDVSDSLQEGYKETYYKTTFDNQKGIGFAYEFNALDDNKVRVAISQNWQGSNFSDRIWNDKNKLIETINQKIPQGVALGQNPRKVARDIAKSLDTRYSNCERLARTEMNHIANESQKLAYKETPEILQQYKILATLDNRTSEICFVGMDKVQTVSDVEKLFKRNYTGKIITITTACGNQIKGTPNHPVLTSNGWLTLDEINPNEHIVYSILDESVGVISKKNVNVPTKLSKLFNSIREITVGKIQTASPSTTKFNNKRTIWQGKIHVLNTDRILRYWRKTVVNKHIIKDFFTFIHNSINLFCLRVLCKFFFTREIVNMTPEVEVFTFSKLIKPTSRPIKFFNNFGWFNSIIEHINSSNFISVISAIMFAPLNVWHNPEFFKNICNSRGRSFILFCNFASGHTVPVLADNVIDKRCEFTNNCQVYNLQTSDNTYINNKIIVHNCQEQDGKVYKMSEWIEGVTAPPFHPNCYDDKTEVYTNDGWKLFKDCKENDLYYSLNPETMQAEYLKANKQISYLYTGNLLNFTNRSFDLCVTPEHKIILKYAKKDGSGNLRFISAKNMPKYGNAIPRGIKWIGNDIKSVKLGGYDIDIDLYLKFMGYYLSEGSCTKIKDKNSYRIKISQKKYLDLMYKELKQLPFGITLTEEAINCYNYNVCKELKQFGKSYEKYVPEIIKTLSSEKIKIFLNAYILGDGSNVECNYKGGNFENEKTIFTSSNRMANDLTELILKAGGRPSFKLQKNKGVSVKHRNGIYTGNYDIWIVRWGLRQWTYTDNLIKSEIPYNNYVYCVELPKYHTLLVRRNGKVCWCGNCRTTTIPYFEDMPIDEYGRIATDYSTGQAYYVPSNLSYTEWKNSLSEKQQKYFIADKKIRQQHNADKEQLNNYRKIQTIANKNGDGDLFNGMPTKLQQWQELKYLEPDKYAIYRDNYQKYKNSLK